MSELKTLEDISIDLPTLDAEFSARDKMRLICAVVYTHCDVKQLGIKWIKVLQKGVDSIHYGENLEEVEELLGIEFGCCNSTAVPFCASPETLIAFIKYFFNITEEDLKCMI